MNYKVVEETPTSAVSQFTVKLPPGCTIPLSVVSYKIATCGVKFPQTYVDGNSPAGKLYTAGTYTNQMRVNKMETRYQVDLRVEGFTVGENLTQQNEDSYYRTRTLAWIIDKTCVEGK